MNPIKRAWRWLRQARRIEALEEELTRLGVDLKRVHGQATGWGTEATVNAQLFAKARAECKREHRFRCCLFRHPKDQLGETAREMRAKARAEKGRKQI